MPLLGAYQGGSSVLQDPPGPEPCTENPVSVHCTGGFGGGAKAHGVETPMPENSDRTLNLGAAPEIEGPSRVSAGLRDAWGYMFGYANGSKGGSKRSVTPDVSGPDPSAWDASADAK